MDNKKRAPNFANSEKVLLLHLISDFKDIIENKKTNSQTWREKDAAWQKIADRFNSETPESFPRTKDALKKYYDNSKKNLRKDVAEEKTEIRRTGGGGYKIPDDPIKEMALGLVNNKTVFGLRNDYDSDVILDIENDHDYSETSPCTSAIEVENSEIFNVPSCSKEQRKQGSIHVVKEQCDVRKHAWTKRRRPAIQQLPSSKLSEEYMKLAKLKQECYEVEKAAILKRSQHEEEIFQLKKRKLLLEITNLCKNNNS